MLNSSGAGWNRFIHGHSGKHTGLKITNECLDAMLKEGLKHVDICKICGMKGILKRINSCAFKFWQAKKDTKRHES